MSEEELRALSEALGDLFGLLERRTVGRICARLKKIGRLTGTDIHQLERLTQIGADLDVIEKDVAAATIIGQQDAYNAMYAAAIGEYEAQREVFERLGKEWIPFEENTALQTLVEAICQTTASEMANITRTTGFVGDITGLKQVPSHWSPLATYYQEVVDYAALQVRSGVDDYYSAIRGTVQKLADNGLRHIEYDNAGKRYYARRLDSSVRNAVNGGLQRLSMAQAELVGTQFEADGMEISAHSGARESHQWFQGLQFPMAEYHRDVVPYLDDYNCYHRAFPILLGISPPAHSPEELEALREADAQTHDYEGKSYNAYDARQKQRQIETAIRKQKDRAVAFGAVGDTKAEHTALAKAAALNKHYSAFSNTMGLSTNKTLLTTVNFSRSQAAQLGAITRKLNTISTITGTVAKNGTIITATAHLGDQAIARGISAKSIQDALTSPLHIGSIRSDGTYQFIGRGATVPVDAVTGNATTVWSTKIDTLKKYGGGT